MVQQVSLLKEPDPLVPEECRGPGAANGCGQTCGCTSTEDVRAVVATDAGMSTVEYAVGTVVAAAFAAVLYQIVTGDSVISGLTDLINRALSTSF